MKRILALLLALSMLFTFAACSKSDDDDSDSDTSKQTQQDKDPTVKDDAAVMAMSYTPPESFGKVERYIEEDKDGAAAVKIMTYTLSDDAELTYVYLRETKLDDVFDADSADTLEQDGKTFYCLYDNESYQAYTQVGDDLYAFRYLNAPDEKSGEKALKGVSFTDASQTLVNDHDLYDITYKLDKYVPLYACNTDIIETAGDKELEKSVIFRFGKNDKDIKFRFMIRVYHDTTVKKLLDSGKSYEQQTVNGIEYTVSAQDDKAPYEYYAQHGDDVYYICNIADDNGWYSSRSEESEEAFADFINGVGFKES